MKQVTLNVQGMSCGHCVNSIEESVGTMNGVNAVKVHLDTGSVEVSFEPETVSLKQIEDTIEEQGYDIEK